MLLVLVQRNGLPDVQLSFSDVVIKTNQDIASGKTNLLMPLVPRSFGDEFFIFNLDCFEAKSIKGWCLEEEELVASDLGKMSIRFSKSGCQPTTDEAGEYSGARITKGEDSKKVTSWYMYAFGGKAAEPYMDTKIIQDDSIKGLYPAFGNDGRNIITVPGGNKFKKKFWNQFKLIASDPVRRVLLYRLLIEIKRVYRKNYGQGRVHLYETLTALV